MCVVIIVMITNGRNMLNVNSYFEQTFLGLIILLAVGVVRIQEIYGKSARPDAVHDQIDRSFP